MRSRARKFHTSTGHVNPGKHLKTRHGRIENDQSECVAQGCKRCPLSAPFFEVKFPVVNPINTSHFYETLFLFNFRGLRDRRHRRHDVRQSFRVKSGTHDDEVTRTVVTECGTVIRPNAKQAPYHTPVAPRAILASPRHVVSATHCAAQLHACTKNQLDGIYCQVAFVSVVF